MQNLDVTLVGWVRILLAWIACWWYCLFRFYRGVCMFSRQDGSGKTVLIAAVTGSLIEDNLKVVRVFFMIPVLADKVYKLLRRSREENEQL